MNVPESTPCVNPLDAALFLRAVAGQQANHFIRAIKGKANKSWYGPWTDELAAWCGKLNGEGFNTYYAVNGCGAEGPKTSPATALRCIYLDDDNEATDEQRDRFSEFSLAFPPHLVVNTSPNKYQYIWLTVDLPLALQPLAGGRAAAWFGTDRQVIDTARILRLPGYRNWSLKPGGGLKYPEGPLVTFQALDVGAPRTELDIREAFGIGDHSLPGNHLHTIGRTETSQRSKGMPATFDREKTPRPLGLAAGAPGCLDTGADKHLSLFADELPVDSVLDTLSVIDPDSPSLKWMTAVWAIKAASEGASWGAELAELWSTGAKEPWPDTFQSVWDRGDSRSDWRTILKRAAWPELSGDARRQLRTHLDAFKRSHPELRTLRILSFVPDFPDKTIRDAKPASTVANFHVLLKLCECRPRYDHFTRTIISDGEHVDDHARFAMAGVAAKFEFLVSKAQFADHLAAVAHADCFDSGKDWLASMPAWDGVPRLYTALHRIVGAEQTHLNGTMFTLWLCGGVRRLEKPGTQFPAMLVLKGLQGLGKSAFFRELAGGHARFNGNMKFDTDLRALEEQTRGCVIVELGELSGLAKRDREHVKTFISSEVDIARAAYAQDVSRTKRRFILAGSTNFSNLLKEKDNRRWWIVTIPEDENKIVDEAQVRSEMPQLWAEAIALEPHLGDLSLPLDLRRELAFVQSGFRSSGVLTDDLNEVADFNGMIVKSDLWAHCGYAKSMRPKTQGLIDEMREFMEEHGWKEKVVRLDSKPTRVWCRIKEKETAVRYSYDYVKGFMPGARL